MTDDGPDDLASRLWSSSSGERERAFAELVRRFYGRVLRRLPASVPAEVRPELAQEVFLRISRQAPAVPVQDLRAWIDRITVNAFLTWSQARRRQKRLGIEVGLQRSDHDRADAPDLELASSEPEPERVVLAREEIALLRDAIRRLSPPRRRALLLHLQGVKLRDIACLLRLAEGTVKSHIHAARERLKEDLAEGFRRSRIAAAEEVS